MSKIKEVKTKGIPHDPNAPELEINFEDYRGYLALDEDTGTDKIVISAQHLFEDWIGKDGPVDAYIADKYYSRDTIKLLLEDKEQRELRDILLELTGSKIEPEIWKMSSHDFRRYICQILGLGYHVSRAQIIETLTQRLI